MTRLVLIAATLAACGAQQPARGAWVPADEDTGPSRAQARGADRDYDERDASEADDEDDEIAAEPEKEIPEFCPHGYNFKINECHPPPDHPPEPTRRHTVREMQAVKGFAVEVTPYGAAGWSIQIANKSGGPASILWDDSSLVLPDGVSADASSAAASGASTSRARNPQARCLRALPSRRACLPKGSSRTRMRTPTTCPGK